MHIVADTTACQSFCFEFLTVYETQAASETSLASAGSTYSAATGKADQLDIEDTAKAEQEKNSAVVKATATYNEQRIAVQKHAKEQYAQLREDLKANANSIAVTFEHSKNQADAVTCPFGLNGTLSTLVFCSSSSSNTLQPRR